MPLRTVIVLLGLLAVNSNVVRAEGATVKYTRDSSDRIIGVDLPAGTTTATFDIALVPETTQSLIAHNSTLSTRDLRAIAAKCKLKLLDLTRSAIDDSYADALSQFVTLESLYLSSTKANDALISQVLPSLSLLTGLDLSRTHITNRSLPFIGESRKLIFLSIAHCSIRSTTTSDLTQTPGLAEVASLQHLESLDLAGLPLTDRDLRVLCGLSTLTFLKVSHEASLVSSKALRRLYEHNRQLKIAEHICLAARFKYKKNSDGVVTDISDAPHEDLLYIPENELALLHNLDLVDATDVIFLKSCKSLKSLSLRNSRVSNDGAAVLQQLKGLSVIRLNRTDVSEQGVASLVDSRQIEKIIFDKGRGQALPAYITDLKDDRVVIEEK